MRSSVSENEVDSDMQLTGGPRLSKEADMDKWEYLVAPLDAAAAVKKGSAGMQLDQLDELGALGWEAVGMTLKRGDLVAWPVVLFKRPVG
jgi:hypothetical protein